MVFVSGCLDGELLVPNRDLGSNSRVVVTHNETYETWMVLVLVMNVEQHMPLVVVRLDELLERENKENK